MSDKPEKIYAYPGSLIYSLKPAEPHTVEYIRADLAKPIEWISVELKRVLLAVNKVTAQHRHHNLPTKRALDNLSNRQLEYEESLRKSPPRETP